MPKNKSHKGLLKRIRITKTGKVKAGRAFARHLKSHKSGSLVRQYRRGFYVSNSEARRLSKMLHRKVRGRDSEAPKKKKDEKDNKAAA